MNCLRLLRLLFLTGTLWLQLGSFTFEVAAAAPPNDRFSNAQVISASSGTTTGTTVGASKQPGEPDHADNPGGNSIWFRWTAPASGLFLFDTFGSSFDTLLAVYIGTSVDALTVVTNNDDYGFDLTSEVGFRATAGITYQLAVDGYDGTNGSVILHWAPEPPPPANDNFANATPITGASGSTNGNNSGATLEPGEPVHADVSGGRSVWFRWTAPATGNFSFNTVGSLVDTLLAVYTGGNVNALTLVAANDDFPGADFRSSVSFRATNGITYFVAIDGSYSGTLVLNWGGVISEFLDEPLSLRTLHHFTNSSDGARPHSELVLSGNTLYGTTVEGGTTGSGTIFKVNTDGTGYSILHHFNGANGSQPFAGLLVSGDTLFGTTRGGGSSGWGTVFSVRTNGTGFTNLYKFTAAPGPAATNRDGSLPHAPLALSASGNTLYGATTIGGAGGKGTLFAVNTDGTGFTNLYNFSATSESDTNSDGANPYGKLIVSGNTLYGTTFNGGLSGDGTVFAVFTNGTGFTTLHHFRWEISGANPHTTILSGNRLYGTGVGGGTFGSGVVFALNTDGTGFTNLYRFSGVSGLLNTNRTGSGPFAGLALAGDTLYGATLGGGSGGKGTLFSLNTNGTNFKSLYHFTSVSGPASTNNDGATLRGELVFSGNTLFGSAERGGSSGVGTLFSLSLTGPPHLAMTLSQPNVILRWASAGPFSLQATTNPSAFDSWSAVGQPAVTNAAEISVTVPAAGERKFFRLKSQ
jgi:uncharacterized repeat protein (TIGR03803 family)